MAGRVLELKRNTCSLIRKGKKSAALKSSLSRGGEAGESGNTFGPRLAPGYLSPGQ